MKVSWLVKISQTRWESPYTRSDSLRIAIYSLGLDNIRQNEGKKTLRVSYREIGRISTKKLYLFQFVEEIDIVRWISSYGFWHGFAEEIFCAFHTRRPVNPEICITFLLRWLALAYISSAACIYFPPDWTKPFQRETVSSMARILFQFYRGQCYLKVILKKNFTM